MIVILRALHLIDPRSAGWPAVLALAELAARRDRSNPAENDVESVVALLGGGPGWEETERGAYAHGLRPGFTVCAPLGRAELAAPALRGAIARLRPKPDVVHAWGAGALTAAMLARTGIALSGTMTQHPPLERGVFPRLDATRALALAGAERARSLLFPSRVVLDGWRSCIGGLVALSHLPLPMLECDSGAEPRASLRAQWGLGDETLAILATGEPGEALDARWFAFRAGVLTVAGAPAAIVLPRACRSLERAMRYVERHNSSWRIIIDERPVNRLLCGCDMALWRAGPAGSCDEIWGAYGLALAASFGLACVAEDHPLSREALASADGPRLVPAGESVAISRALFECSDEIREARRPRIGPARSTIDEWIGRMNGHLARAAGVDASFPEGLVSLV